MSPKKRSEPNNEFEFLPWANAVLPLNSLCPVTKFAYKVFQASIGPLFAFLASASNWCIHFIPSGNRFQFYCWAVKFMRTAKMFSRKRSETDNEFVFLPWTNAVLPCIEQPMPCDIIRVKTLNIVDVFVVVSGRSPWKFGKNVLLDCEEY